MAPVATYVFIDLETTGLPKEELNKTKIIELSFIAVKRSHILSTRPNDSPRVQQKLTLCLNPGRVVQPDSSKITGLCNYLLEYESPFNMAVFDTINSFLSLLSKPVCLVAHNGITYDYPILKKHLANLNVSLSDDLLCADCLHCFYDIEKKIANSSSDTVVEETISNASVVQDLIEEPVGKSIQKQNERTPTKCDSAHNSKVKRPIKRKLSSNPKDISSVRRRIYFGDDSKPEKSYKLNCIYERYLNRSAIVGHRAENDCIMALECSVAKAKEFVEWIDDNHCLFADIKPMTVGIPLGY